MAKPILWRSPQVSVEKLGFRCATRLLPPSRAPLLTLNKSKASPSISCLRQAEGHRGCRVYQQQANLVGRAYRNGTRQGECKLKEGHVQIVDAPGHLTSSRATISGENWGRATRARCGRRIAPTRTLIRRIIEPCLHGHPTNGHRTVSQKRVVSRGYWKV